jgi:hypothetical protein
MSAKANNRFVPSFEGLESRDGPSSFSLSSAYLQLARPALEARAPAQQMLTPTEYSTTDYRSGSSWLAQYGHSYFPNYLQHLTPAQIQTLLVQSPGSAVVSFAEQHLGQKVWSPNWSHNMMGAQCTDLVDAALQSAGAKTFNQFSQPSDPNGDYVWGNLALKQSYSNGHLTLSSGQYSDIAAGDILQFRNVRLNNPDGSWSTDAHHTAIVEKNLGNGRLQILQQNSNNQHFVTRAVISINAMTQADPNAGPAALWVYHPVPR